MAGTCRARLRSSIPYAECEFSAPAGPATPHLLAGIHVVENRDDWCSRWKSAEIRGDIQPSRSKLKIVLDVHVAYRWLFDFAGFAIFIRFRLVFGSASGFFGLLRRLRRIRVRRIILGQRRVDVRIDRARQLDRDLVGGHEQAVGARFSPAARRPPAPSPRVSRRRSCTGRR